MIGTGEGVDPHDLHQGHALRLDNYLSLQPHVSARLITVAYNSATYKLLGNV